MCPPPYEGGGHICTGNPLHRDGSVAGMATIIGKMANDHPRDGGHPWDRLEDFDHFGRVTFLAMVAILWMVTIIGMVTILEIMAVLGFFS